jgi:hypothetical protein
MRTTTGFMPRNMRKMKLMPEITWETWVSKINEVLSPPEIDDLWVSLQQRKQWLQDEINSENDWDASESRPSNRLVQVICILKRIRDRCCTVGDLHLWISGAPDILECVIDRIANQPIRTATASQ